MIHLIKQGNDNRVKTRFGAICSAGYRIRCAEWVAAGWGGGWKLARAGVGIAIVIIVIIIIIATVTIILSTW